MGQLAPRSASHETTHLEVAIDVGESPRFAPTPHSHSSELLLRLVDVPSGLALALLVGLPLALVEEGVQSFQSTRRHVSAESLQTVPDAVQLFCSVKVQLVDREVARPDDERCRVALQCRWGPRDRIE